jgi:MFS family permease
MKSTHGEAKVPFFDMCKRFPGNMLLGLGARHIDGVFFNIFSVFTISYLTANIGISRNDALVGVMIGGVVLTIFIPVFGRISDWVGRPRLYGFAELVTAASVYPAFWIFMHHANERALLWAAIAIPYGILYAAVYGTVSVFLCELFDARVRYTGISFVYQVSSVTAGGLTPIIATVLVTLAGGSPWLVCAYVAASGVVSSICAFVIKRRGSPVEGKEPFGESAGSQRRLSETS